MNDDAFGWAMFNAIIAAYRMERPRIGAESEPAPEPAEIRPPPYCDIYRHGVVPRIRAKCHAFGQSHTIGYFDVTEDGSERARAAAEAARQARDDGTDLAGIKRAGRQAGGL